MASFKGKRSIESLDDIYREAIKRPEGEGLQEHEGLSEEFLSGDVFSADGPADGSYGQVIMHSLASHDPAWHGKEVAIAADRMRVTIKVSGGQPISSYQLNHGLEQLGVTFGTNWQALKTIEEQTKSGWQGEMVVAKGTPSAARRTVTFPVARRLLELDGSYSWLLDGVKLDGAALKDLFAADRLERLEKKTLLAKAVTAGTVLAMVYQNPEGKPGMNVMGEVIDPQDDPLPDLGDNVRHNEELGAYEATQYGYLAPEGNSMSVLAPIWLSPDQQGAYYVNLAQLGPPVYPVASDLANSLLLLGVSEGTIRRVIIDKIVERLAQGQLLTARTVKIAEAISPKAGSDSRFSFAVDMGAKAEAIREDGTIDLRGRKAVVSIQAGDLIAEKVAATRGVTGFDLFGAKSAAADGVDRSLAIDEETIRVEERDGRFSYYAKKPGNVRFARRKLTIADIYPVSGDVDANTGNLDRQEDLLINGSVLAGLTVKSQGNIVISGSVYNGAKVVAGGDITIGEGIVGNDTRVVALGNLQAVFIQDAEVIVKGDAVIRSYLYNAVLRANGCITVLKDHGQKSGRIIGGVTCASQGIEVTSVGYPGQPGTVLAILPDPEHSGQLLKLEEEGRNCRENIAKVSRSLPFESFESAAIKRALARLPVDKREAAIKLLTVFNNLIKRQQNVEALRKEISARIASDQRNATIRITGEIIQGSEVQFGDKKLAISADMGPATFSLQGGQIV